MSGTYVVEMGDRGRLVVPAALRRDLGWSEGTRLHFVESASGVVVMTRSQLKDYVRSDLHGLDLVGSLLADRRAEAATE